MILREFALYGTIWLALTLFVIGHAGQRAIAAGGQRRDHTWGVWCLGALLCVVHAIVALGVRHGWSHDAAEQATALQTEAVYGVRWGGGVYVNYVFAGVWLAEAAWWRINAQSFFARPRAIMIVVRAFYLLILVNAAIVFAAPSRRLVGMLIVAALVWVWRPAPGQHTVRLKPDTT